MIAGKNARLQAVLKNIEKHYSNVIHEVYHNTVKPVPDKPDYDLRLSPYIGFHLPVE